MIVACVKWGERYGAEYVNILFDMVRRNLPSDRAYKFVCFTDAGEGLCEGIEQCALPGNLKGWWNKLYLFKSGVFPAGEQVVYFDLDTLVTGPLDEIAAYEGKFAILRDFYRPGGYQSSVMSWQAGALAVVWDLYEQRGFPEIEGGDQAWIEACVAEADIWQDLLPGRFVSYKKDCAGGLPKRASVVVFHGLPRPHQVTEGFVPLVWKEGGAGNYESFVVGNTPDGKILKNIDYALTKGFLTLDRSQPAHDGQAVIVGGGPSLEGFAYDLLQRKQCGQKIVALNNAWRWLAERCIEPDIQCMMDARPENAAFIAPEKIRKFYASQCAPEVFDRLNGENVVVWHAYLPEFHKQRPLFWIGSGTTIGIRAILLMYVLGYRKFHLYGYDSSYRDGAGHAYRQRINEGEKTIEVVCGERNFTAAPWMVTQAEEFLELAQFLTHQGCEIYVHGDGLLPHAAQTMLMPKGAEEMTEIAGTWWPTHDFAARFDAAACLGHVERMAALAPERRVAVQAGGNVGLFAKKMAGYFDAVYTFEPDELNFKCLEKNVTEPNVVYFRAALGEKHGWTDVERVERNCGANFLKPGSSTPVMTIDSLDITHCDLIQLDVEGAELPALKGAVNTITRFRPVIVCEEKGHGERFGVRRGEIAEFLAPFGYRLHSVLNKDYIFTTRQETGNGTC